MCARGVDDLCASFLAALGEAWVEVVELKCLITRLAASLRLSRSWED